MIIDYTNHRGERGLRNIEVGRVYFGRTDYHPERQWLVEAHDKDKNETRHFALKNIHAWDLPEGVERPKPEVRVVQVTFPIEVNQPLGFERQLDALVDSVCQEWMRNNPTRIMWPSGHGSAPQWNEPHEPTFDNSTYQVSCTTREDTDGSNPWNPAKTKLREEMRAEHKRRKAERAANESRN